MSEIAPIYEIIECDGVLYTILEVGTDGIQVENYQEVENNENYEGMSSELDLEEVSASEFMEMNYYNNLDHMGSQYIQSEVPNDPGIHINESTGYCEHQMDQNISSANATTNAVKRQSKRKRQPKKPFEPVEPKKPLKEIAPKPPAIFHCTLCKMSFLGIDSYRIHWQNFHEPSMSLNQQENVNSLNIVEAEYQEASVLEQLDIPSKKSPKEVETPGGALMAKLSTISYNRGKKFCCLNCKFHFSTIEVFHHHRKAHNFKCNDFLCKFCCEKFDAKAMNVHVKAHEHKKNREEMQCGYCEKTYIKEMFLAKHLLEKHRKITKLCKICLILYEEKELQKHIEEAHGTPKSFKCENCGMKFNDESGLTLHYELYGKSEGWCQKVIDIDDD